MSQVRKSLQSLRNEAMGDFLVVVMEATRIFMARTAASPTLSYREVMQESCRLAQLAMRADSGGFTDCEAAEICLLCAAVPVDNPRFSVAYRARELVS